MNCVKLGYIMLNLICKEESATRVIIQGLGR